MKLSTGQPIIYYSNWLNYEVVGIVQSATNKTVEFLVNGSDQERFEASLKEVTPISLETYNYLKVYLKDHRLGADERIITTDESLRLLPSLPSIYDEIPFTQSGLLKLLKPLNETGGEYGASVTFHSASSGTIEFLINYKVHIWEVEFESIEEAIIESRKIIAELEPSLEDAWNVWNLDDEAYKAWCLETGTQT